MTLSGRARSALTVALIAAPVGAFLTVFLRHGIAASAESLWRIVPGLAIYVGFGVYWDIAGRNASDLAQSESRASACFHQTLVGLSLLLIVFPVPALTQWFVPSTVVSLIVGLAIELLGVKYAASARRMLGTNWSREVAITEGHRLVREGPYARVRHPIYAGALLIYVGLALCVGRVHALVGLALVCVTYWRKISMEERILRDTYGTQFEAYRRDSWAVIPHVL